MKEEDLWLCPIEDRRRIDSSREGMFEGLSIGNYLLLVDYTGRLFREGKASISADLARILERIGISAGCWQLATRTLDHPQQAHWRKSDARQTRTLTGPLTKRRARRMLRRSHDPQEKARLSAGGPRACRSARQSRPGRPTPRGVVPTVRGSAQRCSGLAPHRGPRRRRRKGKVFRGRIAGRSRASSKGCGARSGQSPYGPRPRVRTSSA